MGRVSSSILEQSSVENSDVWWHNAFRFQVFNLRFRLIIHYFLGRSSNEKADGVCSQAERTAGSGQENTLRVLECKLTVVYIASCCLFTNYTLQARQENTHCSDTHCSYTHTARVHHKYFISLNETKINFTLFLSRIFSQYVLPEMVVMHTHSSHEM